uniref:Uncharacterized protein n=1 Tax=viral metagenome TaxID=1070528 RepID=A0A6C0J260_9ZZZZ
MSYNNTKSVSQVTSNITKESQNYDITKEENSKIRYLMSYYGY